MFRTEVGLVTRARDLFPTLIMIAVMIGLQHTPLRPIAAAPVLLLVVAYTSIRSGTLTGLCSAALSLACGLWLHATAHRGLRFDQSEAATVLTTAICLPAMALLIGTFKRRSDAESRRAGVEAMGQEMRESHARLDAIVNGTSDGVYIKDLTGRYLLVNAAAAGANNLTVDQIVGRRDVDLLAADVYAVVAEQDRQVIGSGKAQAFEQTIDTPRGPRTYLTSKGIYTDAQGRAMGIFGISKDITERKALEQEMRRMMEEAMAGRARLEAILQQMPAGVAIAEAPSGKLVLINSQLQQIWRLTKIDPMEIREYARYEAYAPDGRRYGPEDWPLARAIRHGQVITAEEIRIIRGDGTEGWVAINAGPIRDADGNVVAAIATALDLTEQKAVEESAREHQAELAHLARVTTMGQITSGLAHELNQPLGAILNYAGVGTDLLVPGEPAPRAVVEALEEIVREAKRAGEIIRRVRGFVRRQMPQVSATDLNHVVREAVALMSAELRAACVETDLRFHETKPTLLVLADSIQIEQVLVNLIRNAIDAMARIPRARRKLVLTTAPETDQRARISVRDCGCGLDETQKKRLFEAFYTTKPQGLGIGLSISRSIVEGHGGSIRALSNADGPGVTIQFTLPLFNREADHGHETTRTTTAAVGAVPAGSAASADGLRD
jgi:PAS domain S-box-containing protein